MKVFWIVLKVLAALAAVAGAIYVVVAYGDKIAAWFKKLFGGCSCCKEECECEGECECECACECEEVPAEEEPAEAEEPATEEPVVEEGEPVAAEADFEA